MMRALGSLSSMLLLVLLPITASADPFAGHWQPGDAAAWELTVDGEVLGVVWAAYDIEEGNDQVRHLLHHKTELAESRNESVLVMDEAGLPLEFRLLIETPLPSVVEVRFTFSDEQVLIEQGAAPIPVPLPDGRAYCLDNNAIGMLDVLFGAVSLAPGRHDTRLFACRGAQLVPFSYTVTAGEDGMLAIEDSIGEHIRYRPGVGIVELGDSSGRLRFVRLETAEEPDFSLSSQPLVYERPANASWSDEEVRFGPVDEDLFMAGFTLAGTLSVPDAAVHGPGPYPAVFFVSGSGAQDRHGFGSGIDVGTHELLDAIADAGFVVLRVDDSGTGGSTRAVEKTADFGIDHLLGQIRAALAFLAEQPAVDTQRIFLIGHSEGGITAPLMAIEQADRIHGLVIMSGMGRNLREVTREQIMTLVPEADQAEALAQHTLSWDLAARGEGLPEEGYSAEERVAFERTRRWMAGHAAIDVPGTFAAIDCPTLVTCGELDFQVSADRDAREIARLLIEGGNRDVTLRILPGLDHLYKRCPDGVSTMELYADRERHVDEGFLRLVVGWLRAHAE